MQIHLQRVLRNDVKPGGAPLPLETWRNKHHHLKARGEISYPSFMGGPYIVAVSWWSLWRNCPRQSHGPPLPWSSHFPFLQAPSHTSCALTCSSGLAHSHLWTKMWILLSRVRSDTHPALYLVSSKVTARQVVAHECRGEPVICLLYTALILSYGDN